MIPISHDGPDTLDNIVQLTEIEHIEAHCLISEVTGNKSDINAYNLMINISHDPVLLKEQRSLDAKKSLDARKLKGNNVFDTDFQKEMARRSVESEKGITARKKRGPKLGTQRQAHRLFDASDRFTISKNDCAIFSISRMVTGNDIKRVIERIDPAAGKNMHNFTRSIKDHTKKALGWSANKLDKNREEIQQDNLSTENELFLVNSIGYEQCKSIALAPELVLNNETIRSQAKAVKISLEGSETKG